MAAAEAGFEAFEVTRLSLGQSPKIVQTGAVIPGFSALN
jgi:hypothetical protein